ncbi:MAG: FAD-dependent oxidoreductase [Armatimonadetes bacterium]|nr:FAD-dependent oxidoreductase [Armatimonadota bacterium]
MKTYHEPSRDIPIVYEPDVIVVGGGVSGCSAAISAARNGAKVLLIERNGVVGGTATAGLMANIGNAFMTNENFPVVRGIPREVVERLVFEGGTKPCWHRPEQPGVIFDPEKMKLVLIDMLREAGVEVLLHALTVGAIKEGNRVVGVLIESKSGRQAAIAKNVIDATGEADIASYAGAPCRIVASGGSMLFRLANVDLDRAVDWIGEHRDSFPNNSDGVKDYDTFRRNWKEFGFFFFPHHGGKAFKPWNDAIERGEYSEKDGDWYALNAFGMYGLAGDGTVVINSNYLWLTDVDARQYTRAELEGRRMCHKVAEFLRKHLPGFENAVVIQTAEDWGQRRNRLIEGRSTLTKDDVADGREWDDVIGRFPLKAPGEPPYGVEIPFGVMAPKRVEGLLVASGKSVSTDPVGLLRGMSRCMTLGEAAGVAAALGAQSNTPAEQVPIRDIQKQLIAQGAYLGEEDRFRR